MGIVHRDLKPENVIVVADSFGALVPKLFNFGIATCPAPDCALPEDGTLMHSLSGRSRWPTARVAGQPWSARRRGGAR